MDASRFAGRVTLVRRDDRQAVASCPYPVFLLSRFYRTTPGVPWKRISCSETGIQLPRRGAPGGSVLRPVDPVLGMGAEEPNPSVAIGDEYELGDGVLEVVFETVDDRVLTVREYPTRSDFLSAVASATYRGTNQAVRELDIDAFRDD